jgi:hypothetical protein
MENVDYLVTEAGAVVGVSVIVAGDHSDVDDLDAEYVRDDGIREAEGRACNE